MYKPKIYFIGGSYMGCWYVRCFQPLLVNGWSGNYRGLTRRLKPIDEIMREAQEADIIVFHRADTVDHHKMAIALKKMGKKIVFDNDDTYKIDETHAFYQLDDKGFKQNTEYMNNIINNFIYNSDLITCSTEYLAKEYREINPNVIVLPNCVNPDDWSKPKRNETDIVRIGVVGSTAYYHDFDIIKPVLKALNDNKKVQLVMFGLHADALREKNPLVNSIHTREYGFWDTLDNLEHVGWCSMVDYFSTLNNLKLDLMLIPRRESDFNKAKSNLKFLEAAMCEIPCIVSSFKDAPYEKDIDGTNGRYVKTNLTEDWLKEINLLVDNKELRREMGKNAYNYVIKNYNIHDRGHLWAEAYQTLYEKN